MFLPINFSILFLLGDLNLIDISNSNPLLSYAFLSKDHEYINLPSCSLINITLSFVSVFINLCEALIMLVLTNNVIIINITSIIFFITIPP